MRELYKLGDIEQGEYVARLRNALNAELRSRLLL
jgi:hypothetical protein